MASPKDFISPVNSGQKLVYPFRNYLNYLHEKYSDLQTGKIADYIPELALAAPQWFGISVITTDGQIFEVGDCQQTFTVQSISKAFVFGLALEPILRTSL